jgi:hypothetical protein
MFLVISQNCPAWCRMVGAQMPSDASTRLGRSGWSGRSRTLPICCQPTRSRLWKIGTPGKYSKLEQTR